jgi:hypothetical protein
MPCVPRDSRLHSHRQPDSRSSGENAAASRSSSTQGIRLEAHLQPLVMKNGRFPGRSASATMRVSPLSTSCYGRNYGLVSFCAGRPRGLADYTSAGARRRSGRLDIPAAVAVGKQSSGKANGLLLLPEPMDIRAIVSLCMLQGPEPHRGLAGHIRWRLSVGGTLRETAFDSASEHTGRRRNKPWDVAGRNGRP